MRAKSFVLTIIASLSLPNTDYFLDQEWLQPYRFNGNSVEYSLDDYNIKEVVPYEKEEGEVVFQKGKYVISGEEIYIESGTAIERGVEVEFKSR